MAKISDECIIGLDTMKMFKMVLDVGKGMVGVNGKVLPGCFKYVGGAEVPLYPVETVRRVEDRDKTAFVTKYGQFVFNRMPFGLSNAPGTFCRALGLVLRGLSWESVVSFLDDIVILGRGFEDHMKNMEQVLSRFRDFKLKLKPSKCELLKRDIIFLGHKVSKEGVSPNPGKVKEVKEWPTPKNKTELESFLGLINFYREHLDRFADTAACLYRLTGAKVKFDWGEEEEDSFQKLKEAITEAPLLVYPREGGGFVLDTDASDKAIGAVLSQVQDGKERVVAYGSFVLSTAQRNYCVTRRELLAIVVFTKHFRHYLLGNKFKVRTDHNSLIWLMRFKNIEGQLARWIEELQNYEMELLYRAGRDHGNADGMSRLPDMVELCRGYKAGVKIEELPCGGCRFCVRMQDKWGKFEEEVDDVVPLAVREVGLEPGGWVENYTKEEIRKVQLEDEIVGKVLRWLELGGEPQREELLLSDPAVKYFWRFKENLAIRGGVLKYKWMSGIDRWLLVVPEILKGTVLECCHSKGMAGHMGIEKTKSRILERAIWYNLRNSCEEHVKGCAVCNRQKKGCRVARGEQQLFHAGYALERVHIDIMGPLMETQKGNKYILVIVDQFTKWVEAFPLKNQLAETVAGVVVREFVARFGCPLEIHTDHGRNFESELFKEMCELLEIGKTRTTSYRPSANGQVERYNRSIAQIIRCCIGDRQERWDDFVGIAVGAIRATVNRSTGFTPNRMMLGREVMMPLDLMLGSDGEEARRGGTFGADFKDGWVEAHRKAREILEGVQRRQKKYYDLRKRTTIYEVGDVVLRKNNAGVLGSSKKLNPVWKGIWVVNKIMSAVLLEIKNNKKVCVVHHDTIKKCGDSDLPRWVERLRGQIKEREGAKEVSREDKNVGSGEGECELSSVAGEEIVEESAGGDAESTSDTLAYEGGIGKKYVKRQKRKRKVPKWLDQYVWDSEE